MKTFLMFLRAQTIRFFRRRMRSSWIVSCLAPTSSRATTASVTQAKVTTVLRMTRKLSMALSTGEGEQEDEQEGEQEDEDVELVAGLEEEAVGEEAEDEDMVEGMVAQHGDTVADVVKEEMVVLLPEIILKLRLDHGMMKMPMTSRTLCSNQTGIQVCICQASFNQLLKWIFSAVFTAALVGALVNFTNIYAATHILTHSSYADSDGSWRNTAAAEIESLLALFIYFGLVRVSNVEQYWSCKTLYQGLWARRMLSRNRFKALLAFFHVVDPGQEVEGDRLRKVRYTYEAIRQKCRELYQPSQNVSVDE